MCQVENAFVKHRHTLHGNVKDLNEELETEVKRLFRNNTSVKKLFLLSTSNLGLGFCSLWQGDELCILCGISIPILLRPVGLDRFQLVGEGYVRGMVHGAAIPDSNKSTHLIPIV
jgi:hypothetical protein